ncbi:hypothetical protein [Spiroplasma endosymbiont of Ammophila pubescens]|uniref:hypothetical protein n=1 Tax=Spiroplasma endosymbiont of Ammophila pubescens TaxID=3066315 RepID=UPI0032B216FB
MILVLDNGEKYKVNDREKKNQILDIFYSSVDQKWSTYVVMSEQQFILLKDLATHYHLKNKDVFIKLLNEFNLDISLEQVNILKNKITYNKKYIVRTFNINRDLYRKMLLIREMFNLKRVVQVWNILLDLSKK